MQAFLQGPAIYITVRRSHIYEDAYDKLRTENGLSFNHFGFVYLVTFLISL